MFGFPARDSSTTRSSRCIELFGDKVIPEFDTDPVHSTTRYRQAAAPKYPDFAHPVPDIDVTVIPESALLPLA